jgi:vitamin-K-epoxide reductase (warfarin-sensitive)
VLSVAGIAVSIAAPAEHYASPPLSQELIRSNWNSAYVNQSSYAFAFGIPVAMFGIAGYSLLALLEYLRYRMLAALFAGLGLIYAIYLTHIEAHILRVWCFSCVTSLVLIAAITLLAFADGLSGANPLERPGHRA